MEEALQIRPSMLPHSPHAEEARSAVSKHEGASSARWMLLGPNPA